METIERLDRQRARLSPTMKQKLNPRMLPLSGLLSLPTKERGTVPLPFSFDILPMDSALDRKWPEDRFSSC
jgi:hypothetical protein|uniref:Uncharacterized protein n=2 Tax=Picea TaxID=3328 RepID=A0A101M3U0_PICGL|nr:hypothetical protein ABT39_MTgene237 [Picea glauca]QHR90116.1 hypothetical protein Q903MT_gene4139 [Picea sitchensis]